MNDLVVIRFDEILVSGGRLQGLARRGGLRILRMPIVLNLHGDSAFFEVSVRHVLRRGVIGKIAVCPDGGADVAQFLLAAAAGADFAALPRFGLDAEPTAELRGQPNIEFGEAAGRGVEKSGSSHAMTSGKYGARR
jgi:hypothetical protein